MSELAATITGFVVGDNLEIRRTVTDLTAAITTGWLTLKRHHGQADGDAKLQKAITTTDVPGVGQVVTAGGVGVNGVIRFDLGQADTLGLGTSRWIYDIQIRQSDVQVFTLETGTLQLSPQVTRATGS
jgi:hypothetical protein